MKASELKPGQFFEFVDHPERYKALNGRSILNSESRVHFVDQRDNLSWCTKNLEVNGNVPQTWNGPKNKPKFRLNDGTTVGFDGHKFALLAHMQGKTDCKTFDNKWDAEKFAVDLLMRKDSRVFMCEECWMCCGVECDSPDEVLAEWQANLNAGEFFNVVEVPHNAKFVEAPPAKPEPEQFAAGDWVVADSGASQSRYGTTPKQLVEASKWCLYVEEKFPYHPSHFRRATPAEVAEQQRKDYWQHPVVEPELTWTVEVGAKPIHGAVW